MKQTTINWTVRGDVECPHCGHDNEFMDQDEWYEYCEIGETKDFDEPYEMGCEKCGHDFIVTKSQY